MIERFDNPDYTPPLAAEITGGFAAAEVCHFRQQVAVCAFAQIAKWQKGGFPQSRE